MVQQISLYNDETVDALHQALDGIWRNPTDVEVYGRSLYTADPYVLCGISATMYWLRSKGHSVTFHAPAVSRHLDEMQFYDCVSPVVRVLGVDSANQESNWKAILPLRHVISDSDVNEVVGEFIDNCGSAQGWIRSAGMKIGQIAVSEALDNAREHANSEIGTFVAAWAYDENGPLHVAVVDLGVGIPDHLRRVASYRTVTDEGALKLSVNERVSGVAGDKHRGFGMMHIRHAARDVGKSGLLAIRAGAAELRVLTGKRERRSTTLETSVPGTWLRLEIRR